MSMIVEVSEKPLRKRKMPCSMLQGAAEKETRSRSLESAITVASLATGQETVGKTVVEKRSKSLLAKARDKRTKTMLKAASRERTDPRGRILLPTQRLMRKDDVAWMADCYSESDFEDNDSTSTSTNYHILMQDVGERACTTTFDYAALGKTNKSSVDVELFDSGTSRHMSGYRDRFINFIKIQPKPITAADKRQFFAKEKRDMYLDVPNGNGYSRVLLFDVLYLPTMGVTLVSISRITLAGSSVLFHGNTCRIYSPSKILIAQIPKRGGPYRNFTFHVQHVTTYARKTKETLTIDQLHRKLGHVGHKYIRELLQKRLVTGVELDESSKPTFCESCEWGKKHRKSIQRECQEPKTKAVGDEIHADIWRKAPVRTIGGKEYSANFIDGHSDYATFYLMKTKDENLDQYQVLEAWLKTQHDFTIKVFHSDQGEKFMSDAFSKHLKRAGTIHCLTIHDTPEYNGVAERFNRTILEKMRALLHESRMPKFL